jgi:hypothetical protein
LPEASLIVAVRVAVVVLSGGKTVALVVKVEWFALGTDAVTEIGI